jgi:cytochrome c oxidase assembly protein subunit 11
MNAPANRRVLRRLLGVVAVMFGFSFALAPLYAVYCNYTGINRGWEQDLAEQTPRQRWVLLQFDANDAGNTLHLRPLIHSQRVRPGSLTRIDYELQNRSPGPLTGQAVVSYGPPAAAAYFHKVECFCFQPQALAGHETRRLPVLFVLDRELPEDLTTITLSYTFYPQARL